MYTVYMHKFPNGKVYIGATSMKPEKRYGRNGNLYRNEDMVKAINQYKWKNIEHIILFENLTREEAEIKEREMIKLYKSDQPEYGFNVDEGGKLHIHSAETKLKMSKTRKGVSPSESHRRALSKALMNKHPSEEARKNMSASHTGYVMPQSQKDKISKNCKGKGTKAVIKMTLDGEEIETYKSLGEAAKSVNSKTLGNISSCCKGKRPHAYGFKWKYA